MEDTLVLWKGEQVTVIYWSLGLEHDLQQQT